MVISEQELAALDRSADLIWDRFVTRVLVKSMAFIFGVLGFIVLSALMWHVRILSN